jgi:hypothetical protein
MSALGQFSHQSFVVATDGLADSQVAKQLDSGCDAAGLVAAQELPVRASGARPRPPGYNSFHYAPSVHEHTFYVKKSGNALVG